MQSTLPINILIILAIIVAMVVLQNPLALLGLTFLQTSGPDLSRFMMGGAGGDEADDEPNSIGFTADIA